MEINLNNAHLIALSFLFSARAGHGMVCLEDRLYVAGGHNGNREALNPDGLLRCLISMETYDVSTNQWTRLQGMKQGITFFQMRGSLD